MCSYYVFTTRFPVVYLQYVFTICVYNLCLQCVFTMCVHNVCFQCALTMKVSMGVYFVWLLCFSAFSAFVCVSTLSFTVSNFLLNRAEG